jgi:hypothetical protein
VNAFEYLSVLISIILALGMTRVLAGVGEMLQARSRRHIYWVHAIWIFNLFLWLVVAWWIFYRWRDQQPWTFFLFVFVLISPTILYLASLLLFPREGDVDLAIDYKTHYYANHRAFFILFALFTPVDIVDSVLKGIPHVLQLGPQYRMHSTARMVIFCQPFVCTWTCRKNLPLICVSFPARRMTFDSDLKPFEAQGRRARQLTKRLR